MESLLLIGILVQFFIFFIMLAIGLEVAFEDLHRLLRDRKLIGQSLLINLLAIPLVTYLFIKITGQSGPAAIAVMLAAAAPGAPFAPRVVEIARAGLTVSVVLVLVLAAVSVFTGPLVARLTLEMEGSANLGRIILSLLVFQLLPLGVGLALRRWRPGLAKRLVRPCHLFSNLILLLVAVLFVWQQGPEILRLGVRPWLILVAASLLWNILGWMLGGQERHTQSIVAAARNIGLALMLAVGGFGGTAVIMPIFVLGLLSLTLVPAVGWVLGRLG